RDGRRDEAGHRGVRSVFDLRESALTAAPLPAPFFPVLARLLRHLPCCVEQPRAAAFLEIAKRSRDRFSAPELHVRRLEAARAQEALADLVRVQLLEVDLRAIGREPAEEPGTAHAPERIG